MTIIIANIATDNDLLIYKPYDNLKEVCIFLRYYDHDGNPSKLKQAGNVLYLGSYREVRDKLIDLRKDEYRISERVFEIISNKIENEDINES